MHRPLRLADSQLLAGSETDSGRARPPCPSSAVAVHVVQSKAGGQLPGVTREVGLSSDAVASTRRRPGCAAQSSRASAARAAPYTHKLTVIQLATGTGRTQTSPVDRERGSAVPPRAPALGASGPARGRARFASAHGLANAAALFFTPPPSTHPSSSFTMNYPTQFNPNIVLKDPIFRIIEGVPKRDPAVVRPHRLSKARCLARC